MVTVEERQQYEDPGQLRNKLFKILAPHSTSEQIAKDVIHWAPGFL